MEQIVAIFGIAFISFGAGYLLAEFHEFKRRVREFTED
jgi:hypothetical protein